MPNPELVNTVYLLAEQLVRGNSLSRAGKALRLTLPKFSRLVAVFGQQGGFWRKTNGEQGKLWERGFLIMGRRCQGPRKGGALTPPFQIRGEKSRSPNRYLDQVLQQGAVFATFPRRGRTLPVEDFPNLGEQQGNSFRRQVYRPDVRAEFHQEP